MGEVYLDLFGFLVSMLWLFGLERGGLSVAGSLFRDLDREWSLVRTGMVIDILELKSCCCVGIVPEV